jgi:hypothetical protein
MRQFGIRDSLLWAFAALALPGCGKPAAVPPPAGVTADHGFFRVGKTSLTCLSWPDGRAVVVWADIDGFATGTSGPSPSGVRYTWTHGELVRRQKTVRAGDPQPPRPPMPPQPPLAPDALVVVTTDEPTGRGVTWECETADGATGTMTIGTARFDLAGGNVFLVPTTPGGKVTQLAHDFAGAAVRADSFGRLAAERGEVRSFVAAAEPTK